MCIWCFGPIMLSDVSWTHLAYYKHFFKGISGKSAEKKITNVYILTNPFILLYRKMFGNWFSLLSKTTDKRLGERERD